MRSSSLSPNESVIKALMGTRSNVAAKVTRKGWKVWGVQNNIAIRTKQCSLNRFQRFVRGHTQLYPASRVSLDTIGKGKLWIAMKGTYATKVKLVVVVKLFFGERDL